MTRSKKAGTRSLASRRRHIGAFSLTELAIVLGIVGLVVGAISIAYGLMSSANKLRLGQQELIAIANNTRAIYSEAGVMQGSEAAVTKALDGMNVFPLEMRSNTSGMLFNPWTAAANGGVGSASVASGSNGPVCAIASPPPAGTGPASCFAVTFYGIPPSACARMLSQTTQGGASENLLGIGTSTATVTNAAFPLTLAAAAAACGGATTPVSWFYSIK